MGTGAEERGRRDEGRGDVQTGGRENCASHSRDPSIGSSLSLKVLLGYFELGVFGVGVLLALASAVLAAAVAALVY